MSHKPELWGVEDLARELGVSPALVAQWRRRGKLPDPDYVVSGRPIWLAEGIRAWVEAQRARDAQPLA